MSWKSNVSWKSLHRVKEKVNSLQTICQTQRVNLKMLQYHFTDVKASCSLYTHTEIKLGWIVERITFTFTVTV